MAKDSVKTTVKGILTDYLEQNHLRKTPERFAILNAIYSVNKHFTIRELGIWLEEHHFPVSLATLYNSIHLFMQLKLVTSHTLNTGTVYEASYGMENTIRQICRVCGKSQDVKSVAVTKAVAETRLHRFRRSDYTLFIYGTCSNCQARLTRIKNKNNKTKKK